MFPLSLVEITTMMDDEPLSTPSGSQLVTSDLVPPVTALPPGATDSSSRWSVVPSNVTALPALTTTFTPPNECRNRYWVSVISEDIFTGDGLHSDASDRLYHSCQPDPSAVGNYYSPGMCPEFMDIVTVWSRTLDDPDDLQFMDICCQRGFVYDYYSCISLVPSTNALIAPLITTADEKTYVAGLTAHHYPIFAAWHTADLSSFPNDVSSRKLSIAEHGWTAVSISTLTLPTHRSSSLPIPTETIQSVPTQPPQFAANSLGTGGIVGITFAALFFVATIITCIYMRRKRSLRSKPPPELDSRFTEIRKSWLGNAWRAELSSPAGTSELPDSKAGCIGSTDPERVGDKQYDKQEPVELA
ncbi:hypothetical protein F5Y19DRAFT_474826 [Xylariaceae sp. FL1651]|nr:hypothetical protein F5Y19DRAFT_474826 [Xylariaceae sp. FL1651]